MADVLERLKILIDSSTPIIVMETVEEMRAVQLVREASSPLNLVVFEWSIASGLVRCGSDAGGIPAEAKFPGAARSSLHAPDEATAGAIYNSREPAQALGTLESISVEAVFILKDFHRHLEDPVVVRRLRDVGQKFSTNRKTVVITAPALNVPSELASLVEFVELPLPDKARLRQILDDVWGRVGANRTLRKTIDADGLNAVINNLRGLTEEEADRAISQALVTRYGLVPETVTDVLAAKKDLLQHSGMLEFVDASENMAAVGGLENLKNWLAQRRGSWEESAQQFGLVPARGVIILGVQGC